MVKKKPKKSVWFARWLFKSQADAIAELENLHISCGDGDDQWAGAIANYLDHGETLTLTNRGKWCEVQITFPYSGLKGAEDPWISPSQAMKHTTYDLKGKNLRGDSFSWGSR